MQKIIYLLAILLSSHISFAGSVYKSDKCKISFFSSAPLEDIEADNSKGVSAVNFENNKVFFKVPIKDFIFDNSLMQEHFNENYMESDKFPYAKFSGILNDKIDPNKIGSQQTTVSGELEIHGVKKKYTTTVYFTKAKGGKLKAKAKFDVRLEDHNIDIPKVVTKKIAEKVQVSLEVDYSLYEK